MASMMPDTVSRPIRPTMVGVLLDMKSKAIVLVIETSPSTAEGQVIRLDHSKDLDNLYAQVFMEAPNLRYKS